jgi:DNA-binding beta-propeller fold protein YncE
MPSGVLIDSCQNPKRDFRVVPRGKTFRVAVFISLTLCLAHLVLSSPRKASTAFADGDILASIGNGQVAVFASDGTPKPTLDTGLGGFTTGSAFDSAGNFYVTNYTRGIVSKFDSQGSLLAPAATGYSGPESIVFDQNGTGYVGDAFENRFHILGDGDTGPASIEERGTDWISLGPDQKTLFHTSEGRHILRYDLSTDTQLPSFNANPLPYMAFAIRVLPGGSVLVADELVVVHLDTGNVVKTYDLNDTGLFAIAREPKWDIVLGGELSDREPL